MLKLWIVIMKLKKVKKGRVIMKDCGRCFYNDSMSRTCGDDLCHKCNHCLYVDRTYKDEWIAFCELTDEFKNITLGECLGNCENQII